jgi:hypothetical protein
MKRQEEIKDLQGAVVNEGHLMLMFQMFHLHPWSYWDEDPFDLAARLKEQEKAMENLGFS